jgi:hypothetical protein
VNAILEMIHLYCFFRNLVYTNKLIFEVEIKYVESKYSLSSTNQYAGEIRNVRIANRDIDNLAGKVKISG